MSDPRFESALHGFEPADEGMAISLREITDRGMIDLRGSLDERKFTSAIKKVLGMDLPKVPRTSVHKGDITVLWLSVDQWLVCCPRSDSAKLLDELRKALGSVHSLAVEVSDARSIIRLEGDGVRETLMKGAPVDLILPEYSAGTIRRLRFGEVAAMIHVVSDQPDTIDLYVFRSYADFAWNWLLATGRSSAQIRLFGEQAVPES
jgi:sarcosine oxidase subunit gamma